jgi:hypothetical protein
MKLLFSSIQFNQSTLFSVMYDVCSLLLQEVYGFFMSVMAHLDRVCLNLTYF